ncbi:MAG: hypothetical protein AAGB35_07345 [Pseudomonadota bacterium]
MLRKSLMIVISVISMLLVTVDAEQNNYSSMEMSYPMQQSMNPEVWTKMMTMMMNPSQSSPMENCALCHQGEDLARYAEQFGPMMDSMFNMYKSVSPNQAMQYMNPMMSMMNPMMYMNMMYPMMSMMGPMMGMMGPMMNPMAMMGPMMNPMGMMNPMAMMGPMTNPMGMMGGGYNQNPMNTVMEPKEYESWFDQMTEMMKSIVPQTEQEQ